MIFDGIIYGYSDDDLHIYDISNVRRGCKFCLDTTVLNVQAEKLLSNVH